jgi:hypothetical protein
MAGAGQESGMFDLSVVAAAGRWLLVDEAEGPIGDYESREAALSAAGVYAVLDQEPRHVLIQDDVGEWHETVVEPPKLH